MMVQNQLVDRFGKVHGHNDVAPDFAVAANQLQLRSRETPGPIEDVQWDVNFSKIVNQGAVIEEPDAVLTEAELPGNLLAEHSDTVLVACGIGVSYLDASNQCLYNRVQVYYVQGRLFCGHQVPLATP